MAEKAASCELNYKTFGKDGPAIVILHGLFGMLDNWQTIARRLSQDFKVYIVDLRNHGKSCHRDEMSYSIMAQDVAHFLRKQRLSKVHLVGHSMGGKVAMHLALAYQDLVESLIVLDIAPKRYPPGHLEIIRALESVNLSSARSRAEIEAALMEKIPSRPIVLFLMKNLRRLPQGGFAWKMNLEAIKTHYDAIVGNELPERKFSGKVLFIKGGRSQYILPKDEALIKKYFPKAVIVTLPDAGHWVHADRPELLLDLLRKWLI